MLNSSQFTELNKPHQPFLQTSDLVVTRIFQIVICLYSSNKGEGSTQGDTNQQQDVKISTALHMAEVKSNSHAHTVHFYLSAPVTLTV